MYIRHLSVADFRSWARAEVAFEPGPMVLVGANGQGKTNLVEAIGYLATLGSYGCRPTRRWCVWAPSGPSPAPP